MKLDPYPKYKNISISWIREIPSGWSTQKFRHLFEESSEKIQKEVIGQMLSVSGYRGVEFKTYDDENRRRNDEDLIGYRVVRKGQLVVNTMWLNYSGLGFSDLEGHVSPAYKAYFQRKDHYTPYLHYLLRSEIYKKGYTQLLTGIRPNSLQMKREDLMNFPIILPPRLEQESIAIFLDKEVSKINKLIIEKERLIELLKEKRKVLISNAITRGLNPNVTMKDSEVEYLGEIPSHWEIKKLKYIANLQTGLAKGKDYTSGEIISVPFLRVANVQDNYLNLEEIHMISILKSIHQRYQLRHGDVLMNEGGDFDKLGRGCVWRSEVKNCIHQNHVFAVRPHSVSPEWINLYTSSTLANAFFISRSKQTTNLASISSKNLLSLPVPVPPKDECKKIIDWINVQLIRTESLEKTINSSIDLLKEKSSSLISSAVTGKIDLRNRKEES